VTGVTGGTTGGSGLLGLLGTLAGALAVANTLGKDKSADQTAKDAALGSDGTPAPGPGDEVAPDGSARGWLEKGLNKARDWVMGEESGSNDVSKGGAIFDPLKGAGTGRSQPGLGLKRPGGRSHEGIDLFVPIGTPVYAIADGKLYYSSKRPGGKGYGFGLAVAIDHGGGWMSKYAHLSKLVFNRKDGPNGPKIAKGQLIGYSGDTGNAKGGLPHLHFEIHYKGVPQEASQYLTGQKTIPGAKVAANNQGPVKDSGPTPSGSDDTRLAQNDAVPVEAPSTTSNEPRMMNASYTPASSSNQSLMQAPAGQNPNDFSDVANSPASPLGGYDNDPSRYNNLGPGGLPDEQSTLKPEYTKMGMAGAVGAPTVQNALYRSSAPAPTPVPETVPAPKPIELKPPANDNVQSWLNYLKQEFKKAGSLKNGKFAKAIEAAAKKLAVRYPTLAKGLMKAVKNPKALAVIGAAIAVGVGIDWVTNYLREMFPEEVPAPVKQPEKKPAPVKPAPGTPPPTTPAPGKPTPVIPAPKPDTQPDTKPAPVPDTRTKPDAKPAPDARPETAPKTETTPTPGAQPAPAPGAPVAPVEPAPAKPTPTPIPIPLVPVPPGFKKPAAKKPPGKLVRVYGDRPGLTFKDREYDTERATGVSRGSEQLGLGRSEPQTGVIGEPLTLPPTPSFTPDRRASDIDSMSREREKSSRAPLKFDSGTADAYTPPAKAQAVRDQSTAASGGTGASPSSVPNPSAYDIVKEYQLYFLNPSAVTTMA